MKMNCWSQLLFKMCGPSFHLSFTSKVTFTIFVGIENNNQLSILKLYKLPGVISIEFSIEHDVIRKTIFPSTFAS